MWDLESFKIDLKVLGEGITHLSYELDDNCFEAIDAPEVRRGCVKVDLSIKKIDRFFEFDFDGSGIIQVPCDRCLDPMEQEIELHRKLAVKYGESYSEDDDLITVAEEDGLLDVAWFIYEFIALSIPIKHVHAPGKCNPAMMELLNEHQAVRSSEGDRDGAIDPRWKALEKLKHNN